MSTKKPIYLDYQATTPVDPKVVSAMVPYLFENFGNPHSSSHAWGWEAETAVDVAREQVAKVIGANPKDIVFTSGATESNNLALKGVMEFYKQQGKDHLIVSQVEHKCVLSSAHYLSEHGFKVDYLPVNDKALIDINKLKDLITDKTALVSIMFVNNEVGTIQDIKAIGQLCREKGVFFHTDAAQAFGKLPINVDDLNIDLMSISAHKIYGPKGIGALYVRRKPRVRVLAQMSGGGQERGLRSGTLPTHLCVGFGEAAKIALETMSDEHKKIKALSDSLKKQLQDALPKIYINGDEDNRIPGNLNVSFSGVEGESLLMGFGKIIAVSSGSACTSASLESSYVLKAMGVREDLAHTSIRFGMGRFTTQEEIDITAKHVIDTVNHLRHMSPIWEMIEEGIDLNTIEWAEGH